MLCYVMIMFGLLFTKTQVKEENLLICNVNVPDGSVCSQHLDFMVFPTSWQLKFHESH